MSNLPPEWERIYNEAVNRLKREILLPSRLPASTATSGEAYTEAANSEEWEAPMRLEDLTKTMELVIKPIAKAFWFVDCDDLYEGFVSQLVTISTERDGAIVPLYQPGLPVLRFRIKIDFNPDEDLLDSPSRDGGSMYTEEYRRAFKRVWPWFCVFPGVWVEMSDGKHIKIEGL
jgi:hypothetical protein